MKTDRKKLTKWIEEARNNALDAGRIARSKEIANHLISKGVVIPVRCGECKHAQERMGYEKELYGEDCIMCEELPPSGRIAMFYNAFCSYGERRE